MKEKIITETVEVCPHCLHENVYQNWDIEKQGYQAICKNCGERIMLCDECMHADDNSGQKCDWCEEDGGKCFRTGGSNE